MDSKYLPEIKYEDLEKARSNEDKQELYDLLVQPLHEELYRRQDFSFLDELSEAQQLLLSYDYVRGQVLQGGFIQLIQNGYIGLLPQLPGWLFQLGDDEMAHIVDDVLKVYVLNRDMLEQKTTVEEFAKLYDELKEFEIIDERFHKQDEATVDILLQYAVRHMNEFATTN